LAAPRANLSADHASKVSSLANLNIHFMKKIGLLFCFLTGTLSLIYSQSTTYDGTNAGTQGSNNSNFGYRAGECSTSMATSNTAIGAGALQFNNTGTNKSAVGASSTPDGGTRYIATGVEVSRNSYQLRRTI
jgi:hypothetical protein